MRSRKVYLSSPSLSFLIPFPILFLFYRVHKIQGPSFSLCVGQQRYIQKLENKKRVLFYIQEKGKNKKETEREKKKESTSHMLGVSRSVKVTEK